MNTNNSLSGASDVRPKLSALIKDMCPYGVEFKKLGEVCTCTKGEQLNKSGLLDEGYPVINGGINPSGYWSEYNYPANTITISQGGASAGYVNFQQTPFWAGAHCYVLIDTIPEIDYKFLYYLVKQNEPSFMQCQYGAGIPALGAKTVNSLEIPIPPLEIQKKIVEFLDKFSALAAELQAELQMRRKQYEYYRTHLLTPHSDCNSAGDSTDDCNWEWKQITEIADTFIGLATSVTKYKRPQGILLLHNSDIKEGRIELKTVEYLDSDFVQKNGSKILHTDDIITVHTGDVGTSAVITPEYDGTIGFTTISSRIKDKTIITPAFLCKILNSEICKNAIASKTISDRNNLNLASFDELMIPIPPMAEQQRIVDILDKFEALTTSLSDGIPAEQAAQQKRYEYYRDLLLTFPRKAE